MALDNAVCIITGASRGIGRGVAVGLARAGARVHVTGRTKSGRFESDHEWREGSLDSVVQEIGAFGGACTAHQVDHRDPDATRAVLSRIVQDEGRVDLLVNNAWGGYERMEENGEFTWIDPFWKQPLWRWDAMVNASLLPAYICSQVAAAATVEQGRGLIVNISFWAAQKPMGNVVYGIVKAAIDKLSADMADELRAHGVCALSLYPGLVRTEAVMRNAHHFDLANSESPEFLGRIIAGLAQDSELMEMSGTVQVAAALGLVYGISDIDGRRPRPLTLETA